MHQLNLGQWAVALLCAAGIGLSKTGIPGLGVVAVASFALLLPSRESVGVVLPILICGDIVAVASYRRHAVWSHLSRLFPCAAVGIVAGYFAMGRLNDQEAARLIGAILILLTVLQGARNLRASRSRKTDAACSTKPAEEPLYVPDNLAFAIGLGLLAGFTTMVANAAGPILILYLLAMRLPKLEFIGTSAWYFLALNLFKVPFSWNLGLINLHSLALDAVLGPAAVLGALCGRAVLPRINQRLFEHVALFLTLIAAVKLLL